MFLYFVFLLSDDIVKVSSSCSARHLLLTQQAVSVLVHLKDNILTAEP